MHVHVLFLKVLLRENEDIITGMGFYGGAARYSTARPCERMQPRGDEKTRAWRECVATKESLDFWDREELRALLTSNRRKNRPIYRTAQTDGASLLLHPASQCSLPVRLSWHTRLLRIGAWPVTEDVFVSRLSSALTECCACMLAVC